MIDGIVLVLGAYIILLNVALKVYGRALIKRIKMVQVLYMRSNVAYDRQSCQHKAGSVTFFSH